MMSERELYKKALEFWGKEFQINMMIEEMGEAITVLAKRYRNKNGVSEADIVGELVDVEIMLEQMKIIFSNLIWDGERNKKLTNLEKLLGDEEADG